MSSSLKIFLLIAIMSIQGCMGKDIQLNATEEEYNQCIKKINHSAKLTKMSLICEQCEAKKNDKSCNSCQSFGGNPKKWCEETGLNERHSFLSGLITIISLPITIPIAIIGTIFGSLTGTAS